MLRRLIIRNIALIESETIEFSQGFTVFSGETGAGKSLVIDSLNLVLGARGDKSLISFGKDFAQVEAYFDLIGDSTKQVLQSFGLEDEDEIIIVRRLWQDGRNDIKVNGHSLTVKMLKTLSSTLVDVCGQFENQTMFSQANQLNMVDSLANNSDLLKKLNNIFDEIKDLDEKLAELGGDETDRERALDMLSFQIAEIEDANFFDGEEEDLKLKHKKIVGREKVIGSLTSALNALDNDKDDNVADKLKESAIVLSNAAQTDERFAEIEGKLSSLSYEVKDILFQLDEIAEEYADGDEDVDTIEKRFDLLNRFKKKYGETILDINNFCKEAKEKYNLLLDSAASVEKINAQKQELAKNALAVSEEISKRRFEISNIFSKDIQKELCELGMKGAKFEVSISRREQNSRNGIDDVEFFFSANSGIPLHPLSKVASGGELSRFMLALKTVLGKHSDISTMVFDEIDSGISGVIGRILAEKLFAISGGCQVVCVSHLAQIAAMADCNYLIEKIDSEDKTKTTVKTLAESDKVKEIARLAGGESSTDVALAHAADLIKKANEFKDCLNNMI